MANRFKKMGFKFNLRRYSMDVDFIVHADRSLLAFQGPKAVDVLQPLVGRCRYLQARSQTPFALGL
jgi:glycine cleavage system aminomethyltransferase T